MNKKYQSKNQISTHTHTHTHTHAHTHTHTHTHALTHTHTHTHTHTQNTPYTVALLPHATTAKTSLKKNLCRVFEIIPTVLKKKSMQST